MEPKRFYDLQIQLLQSICLADLSLKALLRQSKNLLGLYKKSKQILRTDEANKHWQIVKQICLSQIELLPSLLNLHIAELSPEEDQLLIGCLETSNMCSIVLYEESKLDSELAKFADEIKLTQEQILALQSL